MCLFQGTPGKEKLGYASQIGQAQYAAACAASRVPDNAAVKAAAEAAAAEAAAAKAAKPANAAVAMQGGTEVTPHRPRVGASWRARRALTTRT